MLANNLESIHRRIAGACERTRRLPSQIILIGVTKGVPIEAIRQALALGLTDLGENRVQEARSRREALGMWNVRCGMRSSVHPESPRPAGDDRRGGRIPPARRLREPGRANSELPSSLSPVKWHMIGHLQRNKAKDAVALFDVIHSVETRALAEEIERQAMKQGKSLEVLVQVNVSGQATKFGCAPNEAVALARAVRELPHVRLRGFMTIAPFADDPERSRPHFRRLRALRDEAATALGVAPASLGLSMGMSQDFEVAIEEGADHVRIGTALFGARNHEGQGAGDVGRGKT